MEKGSFQFTGFTIDRSLFETKEGETDEKIIINFELAAKCFRQERLYRLFLDVSIHDANDIFQIEVAARGDFLFDEEIPEMHLESYFYTNAPAILFPYIRSYISTLSHLSGWTPITLPTLNLSNLRDELKANTEFIED